MSPQKNKNLLITLVLVLVAGAVLFFLVPKITAGKYVSGEVQSVKEKKEDELKNPPEPVVPEKTPVSHMATPTAVKALYMTGWVAGTHSMRDHVLRLADTTEVNAILFDIKDDTGKISYPVEDPELIEVGSSEKRIPDLREYTNLLHSKDIYIIGRIASFQDPFLVKKYPESAVKTMTDKTKVWKDRKGLTWIDAGDKRNWDYLTRIAKDAYAQGVDEIQFDYIRFPTDGNMKDIYFPTSEGLSKRDAIKRFFEHVKADLDGTGIVTSADLFGMTTTNTDDLGIGQVLEDALVNFDYVSPMVYPSHYPYGWNGFAKPEAKPYEVVKIAMTKAVERANAIGVSPLKLRPWLQDFGLGMVYGPTEVRAQIKATYDSGLTSWLMWDPKNKYTPGAFLPE